VSGLTFIVLFLILMALAAFIPQALKRFYVPSVVAILLVGIVVGPHALDMVGHLSFFLRGYPQEQLYTVIDAFGLLGLVFLMALAGMEVDIPMLLLEKKAVIFLSVLTFVIPAVAGYAVYAHFVPQDTIGKWVYASLFASHSVGIVFPVIRELKVVQTRFGVAVLASTVITDLASLVLLAVCVQMKRHEIPEGVAGSISLFDHLDPALFGPFFFPVFILAILGFIAAVMWLMPFIGKHLLGRLHPHDDARLTFFLMGVLVVVLIGEIIGVNVIVGAFIAGMAIVRVPAFHAQGGILHRKIEGLGYGFVIPFLFISIGMKTDLGIILAAWENAVIVAVTCLALVLSKVASGWLALVLAGFSHRKGLCADLMTVPQLSATLAAAAIALQLEMLDARFFNAIVCLSVITTLPVPILTRFLIHKLGITFTSVEDQIARLPDHDLTVDEDLI
jgi:Kef-type K+ transport system membrane component KefB